MCAVCFLFVFLCFLIVIISSDQSLCSVLASSCRRCADWLARVQFAPYDDVADFVSGLLISFLFVESKGLRHLEILHSFYSNFSFSNVVRLVCFAMFTFFPFSRSLLAGSFVSFLVLFFALENAFQIFSMKRKQTSLLCLVSLDQTLLSLPVLLDQSRSREETPPMRTIMFEHLHPPTVPKSICLSERRFIVISIKFLDRLTFLEFD